MIQMGDDFEEIVKGPHAMASRVMVMCDGEIVDDTFYTKTNLELMPANSSISYDSENESRTTADLTFRWLNDDGRELMDPLTGAEFYPFLGVAMDDEWLWVPMGVVSVADYVARTSGSTGLATLNCMDRSDAINMNIWQSPFPISKGIDNFTAVRSLLNDRSQGFIHEFNLPSPTGGLLTPAGLTFSNNDMPFSSAVKLSEAESCDLFYDRYGVVKATRLRDPLEEPPTLSLGTSAHQILLSPVTKSVSRREVYSGVICNSEAPWLLFPVRATVWDDDPLSRTWRGKIGERPLRIGDALATTEAQCLQIAQAKFNRVKGVSEDIDFGVLRDPRIEVTDTIEFIKDGLDATGFYILKSLTFNMAEGAMTGRGRRRR